MPNTRHLIFGFAVALAGLAPRSAQASIGHDVADFLGLAPTVPAADTVAPVADAPITIQAPGNLAKPVALTDFDMPTLASEAVADLPDPSVETPLHKFFCVEYARAISGLYIFGDAKYWWSRAKNLYARVTSPMEDAVMVFSGSARLTKGHVAVVTHIVSRREIRVEQANWENHGEIDHATPVLDVSARNDWSKVRVWDRRSGGFGAHVYAVSGFIARKPTEQASRD